MADAQFVAATAQSLGVTAWIDAADIRQEAADYANLSEAARVVRYRRLAHYALHIDAALVLVAHTQDDQAETVLMRLLRGSGTTGLAAMRAVTPWTTCVPNVPSGHAALVRPLLDVSRATILDYCQTHQLTPRHDPSNDKQSAMRVRVRHNLLPMLRHEQPQLNQLLAQTALLSSDNDDFVHTSLMTQSAAWYRHQQRTLPYNEPIFVRSTPPCNEPRYDKQSNHYHGSLREISFGHIEGLRSAFIAGKAPTEPLPFGIPTHITAAALTIGVISYPVAPAYRGNTQILTPPQTITCGDYALHVALTQNTPQPAHHDGWHVFLQPNQHYSLRTRQAGDRIGIGNGKHRRVSRRIG
jgi:tRNA(Ile)-lysidine synthase